MILGCAGTTVAMILVPEAVAFSFMAGLKPLVGLQASPPALVTCSVSGSDGLAAQTHTKEW
jgi:MFS superfamily sulfate permease-like transporter